MKKAVFSDEYFPKPRKVPKQARSRFLVSIIKAGCRKILEGPDSSRLCIESLSQVSGVTVGSIYQYYPNLKAIIAEVVFEDAQNEVIQRMGPEHPWHVGLNLEQAMREIVRCTLGYYQRLLKIDDKFFSAHINEFNLNDIFNQLSNNPRGTQENLVNIYRETHSIPSGLQAPPDIAQRAHLTTVLLRSVIQATFRDDPGYFCTRQFQDYLVATSLASLGASARPPEADSAPRP